MADDADNTITPGTRVVAPLVGDVPERLRRRYFTDERGGPGLGFYVDATVKTAAFRDQGRRLIAARTDPSAIRDMVAIAQHRGWGIVDVRGAQDFRRESWLTATNAGLEVRGYRPTERDLQELTRRLERQARQRQRRQQDPSRDWSDRQIEMEPGARSRLKVVETVVRARVADPETQSRILTAARDRLANWLHRGARLDDLENHDRRAADRQRTR
jgi:hypothetical protein